jgi:hypothetical protein
MTALGVEGGSVRKPMLALPALMALLASSAVGVTAQSPAPEQAGLVTEEVEPGVQRVIRDDAGHDLDEKHPSYRYDMDAIAIAPDGTVWLRTTYSRSDNEAHARPWLRGNGPTLVWALGRVGTYELRIGSPPPDEGTFLYIEEDDTRKTLIEVVSEDGGSIPAFEAMGTPRDDRNAVLVSRSDGEHTCRNLGSGVTCEDPSGGMTSYLSGTQVNQIAAAPDGSVWVVGGYDGDNGGLYRITPR